MFWHLIINMGDTMVEEIGLEDIEEFKKQFGDRIRFLRKTYEWSQEDLAEYASLTPRGISDIENGLSDVKLSTLLKLANAFCVSVSELLKKEE